GLKEAKDAVEQMEAAAPLSPADRSRIVATLRSFGKVEAIKIHMAATGHQNLLESKEAVEAILAEEGIELPGPLPRQEGGPRITRLPLPTGLTPEKRSAVIEAMSRGNKIEAIKIYREATGKGLAESKEAVEAMEAGLP
ncbi:MAG TPA: hypothetical protein PLA50_15145, partial [Bacteroidia bacterium]|nr:hypothetical protein [Bacteroidia bacterium]